MRKRGRFAFIIIYQGFFGARYPIFAKKHIMCYNILKSKIRFYEQHCFIFRTLDNLFCFGYGDHVDCYNCKTRKSPNAKSVGG